MLNARAFQNQRYEGLQWPRVSPFLYAHPVMPHVIIAVLSIKKWSHFSSPQKAELGCGSGFGLLDASKYDTSKGLKSICALGFVTINAGNLQLPLWGGARLACWMMRMHGHQVNYWTCESQGPLGLPAILGLRTSVPSQGQNYPAIS